MTTYLIVAQGGRFVDIVHNLQRIKMKLVVHAMASIATGLIVWIHSQKLTKQLYEMLKEAVDNSIPSGQPAIRSLLILFIDCGYLKLTKTQNTNNITNLI